jgi:hypothetical protein
MALEAPARLQLHEPPVSLRVGKHTSDDLFECAFELHRSLQNDIIARTENCV